MRKLFPLVLTVGLVALAAVLLVRLLTPAPAYDPVQAAAESRAIAQAEALAPFDLLLAALWRLVPLAAVVGALALAGRWAWLRLRLVRVACTHMVCGSGSQSNDAWSVGRERGQKCITIVFPYQQSNSSF